MASKSVKPGETKFAAELARDAKKSGLTIKRLAGDKASVRGDFVFRSLRFQFDGVVDMANGRLEPFNHKLSGRDGAVFEMTVISGQARSRIETRFGKSVQGLRSLVLDVEALGEGSIVGGYADGAELLPIRATGCGCRTRSGPPRPVLAWQPDGSTKAVTLALSKSLAPDLGGLVEVMQTTMARMGRAGGFGDIIDIFDWLLCYLECFWDIFVCWVTDPNIPGTKDIFDTLCMVLVGGCLTTCRFRRPF